MSKLFAEIRYSVRTLLRSPGFTGLAVITLALGIGMTTAIFSAVYGVLLRPLPYTQPSRLVTLQEVNAKGEQARFGNGNFVDIRSHNHSFQSLAAYSDLIEPVSGSSGPSFADVAMVSRDFFTVLGVRPLMGRNFSPQDQRRGAPLVALVSYGYWLTALDGTSDFASKKLKISGGVASVIGVLPPRFSFPSGARIWLPRQGAYPFGYGDRTDHMWRVIGRLRNGVSLAQARSELQTIASRLEQKYGKGTTMTSVAIASLRDALTGSVRQALWILLAAVGFLLLIACANVANLLLVQSAARRHELSVRVALGCSRWRLVRQSVTETLLLALSGGVLGAVAASWGLQALLALSPNVLPRSGDVSLNVPVLAFSTGVCVLVAVVLGLFNALRTSRGLRTALASAGRSRTAPAVSERTTRVIAAGQLAITLVLLTGAALLTRSLMRVLSVDPGFRTEHVVAMNLPLPTDITLDQKGAQRGAEFIGRLLAQIRAIPGVASAGGANSLPIARPPDYAAYLPLSPGQASPSDYKQLISMLESRPFTFADYVCATDGYFKTLGIPLLRGRLFETGDTMGSNEVAVVSESLARKQWPNRNPLGQRIDYGNMDNDLHPVTIVGVVGDVRPHNLERTTAPTVYVNCLQRPGHITNLFNVVMRTSIASDMIIAAARRVVHDLDPSLPMKFSTMAAIVSDSLQARRFNLVLVGVFAGTAFLLAVAGLYGVMAYSVTRRTNEIGIRMALGATESSILSAVLRQSLLTAAIGVAVGTVASFAAARSIRSLLYGIGPTDPVSFAAVALLLMLVALAAGYVPARRATKVDPIMALRDE